MDTGRICIVGCGLIGGSIALALKQRRPETEIVCLDVASRLAAVREANVADRVGTLENLADYLPASSLVILATPVQTIPAVLAQAAPYLQPGTVVTDVGSTKKEVMAKARALLPAGVHFIGGHPMAGAESSGIESADPLLFSDRVYLLCPFPDTPPESLLMMISLVESLLAQPITIDPDEHDRIMAAVSHVPQLIAIALMSAAQAQDASHGMLQKLAGRGFLDMTRLAGSDYTMWQGILDTNRDAVEQSLGRFLSSLQEIRTLLAEDRLSVAWEEAGRKRRAMDPAGRARKADLRSVIDRCDKQILTALRTRIMAARKIGKLKTSRDAPLHDPDRERRMLSERSEWANLQGLPKDLVDDLFAVILKHSLKVQKQK
jgi:prephenate dehydrogenase